MSSNIITFIFFIFVCLYNKLYDQSPDYRPKLKFMK